MVRFEDISWLPDPNTESFLLPGYLVQNTNRAQLDLYKVMLRVAMTHFLNKEQRELLRQRYWQCKTVTEIGEYFGVSPSAVSKRIKAAESILHKQIGFCFEVYLALRKKRDG